MDLNFQRIMLLEKRVARLETLISDLFMAKFSIDVDKDNSRITNKK